MRLRPVAKSSSDAVLVVSEKEMDEESSCGRQVFSSVEKLMSLLAREGAQ